MDQCPVCASFSLVSYKKATFDYFRLNRDQIKITDSDYGKIWDLTRCQNCSHIFANPFPSQDFIRSLYVTTEDPLYEEEAKGRSKNFAKILSFLDKTFPERGVLFDVGAATGILLNLARERGWQVEGIEPSVWAVHLARKRYRLELMEGAFEEAPLKTDYYTSVTMVDFIEHIPHPFEAATKAYKALSPGGILCLVTPDINSRTAKLMGGKWWHFRPGHLGYFTKKSLETMLHRSGFRIIKQRKYSWTFSLHYLLSRRPGLSFLLKNHILASFWKKIRIKLALQDSLEVYARKDRSDEPIL
jgi:SAM-dependent methyltransferase